jgi:hypothetical protein
MVKFEKEGYYLIRADKKKNRFYLSVFGAWKSPKEIPDYINHVKQALQELKSGFACLTHINDKKPPGIAITKLQSQCQKEIMHAGVKRTAVVLPKGRILQQMSLRVITRFTGMEMKMFEAVEEADKWLDEKDKEDAQKK